MSTKLYFSLVLLLLTFSGLGQQSYNFDLSQVDPCSPAGMEENQELFRLYPNPANGVLVVELNSLFGNLSCMDAQGKIVKEIRLQSGTQEVPLNDLPKGLYFIRIQSNRSEYNSKITIE